MANSGGESLKGKRVLVTRPAAQAKGLIAAIEKQNGVAIACPVLAIEPLPESPANKQIIIDLDRYDAIIVVSRNAAQLGLPRVDNYWPQLPAHIRWFAVGKSTAACLEAEGIKPIVPARGFNSEALLELPELQQLGQQRILILKGEGGRELLENKLAERGAEVDSLPLYRRTQIWYSNEQLQQLFSDGTPNVLVATSVDVLSAMDVLMKPALPHCADLPLVVVSERIAEAAYALGYRDVITAPGAADDSIVATLNVIG